MALAHQGKLRPIDWGVLAYVAIASVVALSRIGRIPGVAWSLVANGFAVVLVLLLARGGSGRFGQGLREVYPLILVIIFYGALDLLTGHGGIPTHEATIQRWEVALFGEQVSHTWWQRSPSQFWSTLLHAVYASYYLVVAAGPIWFLSRRDHPNLRRSIAAISATYGICFVIFLLYPVAGPNYEFPKPSAEFLANPPAHLVYSLLQRGSSYGAAFPSSHVAAALIAALVALRGSRRLGGILLVPALLLPVAVVYTQMHYAMDAIAGVILAVVVYGVTVGLDRRGGGSGEKRKRAGAEAPARR